MWSCWSSVLRILTLLKQFQSSMSDTEVRTCECLYFETQISLLANLQMIKTRQKKVKRYNWNVNYLWGQVDWWEFQEAWCELKNNSLEREKNKRTNSVRMFATFIIKIVFMWRFCSSISESLVSFAWTILQIIETTIVFIIAEKLLSSRSNTSWWLPGYCCLSYEGRGVCVCVYVCECVGGSGGVSGETLPETRFKVVQPTRSVKSSFRTKKVPLRPLSVSLLFI